VYIIMELIEWPTLEQVVASQGALAPARVARIGLGLLDALAAAHALGVVHRDVKPGNVMIGSHDTVKLTDFGIALAATETRLTSAGIVGTQAYLAPEAFDGETIGPAADLWSVGATLFHAVQRYSPFQRQTTSATLRAILIDEPPRPECGGPLADVIAGFLTRSVEHRMTAETARPLLESAAAQWSADMAPAIPTPAPVAPTPPPQAATPQPFPDPNPPLATPQPSETPAWAGPETRLSAAPAKPPTGPWTAPTQKSGAPRGLVVMIVILVLAAAGVGTGIIMAINSSDSHSDYSITTTSSYTPPYTPEFTTTTTPPSPNFILRGIDFSGRCSNDNGCPLHATFKNDGGPGAGVATLWVGPAPDTEQSAALASCTVAIPEVPANGTVTVSCVAAGTDLFNYFQNNPGKSVWGNGSGS
jgi:serine/threonine protein kinase